MIGAGWRFGFYSAGAAISVTTTTCVLALNRVCTGCEPRAYRLWTACIKAVNRVCTGSETGSVNCSVVTACRTGHHLNTRLNDGWNMLGH